MNTTRIYPYLFVFVQMACLLYIATSAPVISNNTEGFLVECVGVFLGVLAIYVVRIKNINITPTVKPGSELVTTGIYRIIRHPMYIAQVIAVLPLIIDYFSYARLVALIILSIDLIFKMNYEEKQLQKAFPEYRNYMKKTHRLIPFIY